MTEAEEDSFLMAMAGAVFLFSLIAIVTAVVHIAYRFGFRLDIVPFVSIIEYSLVMVVLSIVTAGLYVWDAPWLSIQDLNSSEIDHDWEDEEGESHE